MEAIRTADQFDPQTLEEAFKNFAQASERLEAKYDALKTEAEELKVQLRQKELEIKRAEKLSLLGETAAAIAHEVRNPLGAIKLFTSLLRRDCKSNPASLELVELIETSIGSLDHIVSNILTFSKEQRTSLAPLNLHSLINEEVLVMSNGIREGIDITLALNANPFIVGDQHGLRQVVRNLLLNAVQAVKHGGRIELETANDAALGTIICVRDSGGGIRADVLSKIFDPFVTTKNEGTGLGLAIVKQIVAQHNGEISAVNRPKGGAEFRIVLPRR